MIIVATGAVENITKCSLKIVKFLLIIHIMNPTSLAMFGIVRNVTV